MLCAHQRPELLTLCLVSLTTFSIYMNKFNFCTLLIPKGCPIIRGSEQPHSSCCLPQGFRTGRAEGSVKRFLLRDTTNPKSRLPFFLHLHVGLLMSVRDVTQWLERMSSLEEHFGRGGKDFAGWLNQQRSFHVRLMLPFIIWNRMSCALARFFPSQRGKRRMWSWS